VLSSPLSIVTRPRFHNLSFRPLYTNTLRRLLGSRTGQDFCATTIRPCYFQALAASSSWFETLHSAAYFPDSPSLLGDILPPSRAAKHIIGSLPVPPPLSIAISSGEIQSVCRICMALDHLKIRAEFRGRKIFVLPANVWLTRAEVFRFEEDYTSRSACRQIFGLPSRGQKTRPRVWKHLQPHSRVNINWCCSTNSCSSLPNPLMTVVSSSCILLTQAGMSRSC
jgi:hypothetical protein